MKKLTAAIDRLYYRQSIWYSFWHGLVVGIGSTAGVAVVLYLFLWVFNKLNFIPIFDAIAEKIRPLLEK